MNTTSVTGRTELFPLLMHFTHATRIDEWDVNGKVLYDEINEIVYDARTIGTKSLKQKMTKIDKYTKKTDGRVNAIDDSKTVK